MGVSLTMVRFGGEVEFFAQVFWVYAMKKRAKDSARDTPDLVQDDSS